MTNPENHAQFAREIGYTTSNVASQALLGPEEKQDLISRPEMLAGIIRIDYDSLAKHRTSVLTRWQSWVSS